ncbi:hypothetical protein NDU88_004797 [Pleurodeles waltl]|uniref:Uncharacterized protein n=1 Tax=Pleurodeles waltl TaxID=8319 RepID=A0AAV7NM30_PLEWA|nr:hypothetical protein NDU88_004797 [Pleurodeles waltl]
MQQNGAWNNCAGVLAPPLHRACTSFHPMQFTSRQLRPGVREQVAFLPSLLPRIRQTRFCSRTLGERWSGFAILDPGEQGARTRQVPPKRWAKELERRSYHKPLEASERRRWVRRLLSCAAVVPPPEAGRCETAAAVLRETEAQSTVWCPPQGRVAFPPAGDCNRRIGGRSARSSRRSRRRVRPLRERSGAARLRCEARRGPRRMKESHATSGTGVSRPGRRRGEEDVRTRVARATTPEARSRQALSSDTTRAGIER